MKKLFLEIYQRSKYKFVTIILILFSAFLELMGISMMYPLLSLMLDIDIGKQGGDVISYVSQLMNGIGVSFSQEYVISFIIFK